MAKTKETSGARKERSRLGLSVTEAAEDSGLSRSTLYLLMTEGELPYSKVRGRRVIQPEDVRRLLERHRHGPAA